MFESRKIRLLTLSSYVIYYKNKCFSISIKEEAKKEA